MLNKLIKFSCFFSLLIFAFSSKVFAKDDAYASTSDIAQEIEKSLIFDKASRDQVDFYQGRSAGKKSDFSIGDSSTKDSGKASFGMIVNDSKVANLNVSEKEKLAYNAALVEQYEVAIELYKQALSLSPDDAYAKFSLAVVYQKIGQTRQAKTLYRELLKTNPDNREEIIGNLLAILVEESPKDAAYLLARLTVQNPHSSYILAQAAVAYDKIKNYDQAITLFKKASLIDPDNVSYKYNLAVIYDKNAEYEKALEMYADVTKNSSDADSSVPVDQVEKRIQTLRSKI